MLDAAALAGTLNDAGHELVQRVYFEDTDFSGRVYHARYLHFMERGRSDYLRLLGIHHQALASDNLAFSVRRMELDFLRPALIDDVLTIRSRTSEIGGARAVLLQEVWRGEELLVRAVVTVALVGPGGRPVRLPARMRGRYERSSLTHVLVARSARSSGAAGAIPANAVETTTIVARAMVAAATLSSSLFIAQTLPNHLRFVPNALRFRWFPVPWRRIDGHELLTIRWSSGGAALGRAGRALNTFNGQKPPQIGSERSPSWKRISFRPLWPGRPAVFRCSPCSGRPTSSSSW